MTTHTAPQETADDGAASPPLLFADSVSKVFSRGLRPWRVTTTALDDVSLRVHRGGAHAVMGESGSGKSTLLRILLGGMACTTGHVTCEGRPVTYGIAMPWFRRMVQYVPQDPGGSLNPRMTVAECVAEPLRCLKFPGDHHARVGEVLELMGIPATWGGRLSTELSGGQRQRVAIARALTVRPAVVVADEPTSALDAAIRHRVLDALHEARIETGCALVVVTHDIAAVRYLCDEVTVLAGGRVVETGAVRGVLTTPHAEDTKALVAAQFHLPREPEPP